MLVTKRDKPFVVVLDYERYKELIAKSSSHIQNNWIEETFGIMSKEEQTVSQLATKYKGTARSITNWKKQFLENASKAFEDDVSSKEEQKELEKLKKENDELAKTLGRTTVERDWAVGKLRSL